jgi:tetratricopeptide (TPR) repeat protein
MLAFGPREGMRTSWSCLFCCLALSLGVAVNDTQEPTIPALPIVDVDNFSPGIRKQIEEAYADALAHLDDDAASGRLGMVLQSYGLFKDAAISYRRASLLAPRTFRWFYYLGKVEASGGHCNVASASLRLALEIKPDDVPAQLQLADCLLASANWDKAKELYAAVVKQHPENADGQYGLGRARSAKHDYAGAAEAYGKACELFPEFGAAHYALALAYRTLGQIAQAEAQLRLYEKNKDSVPPANDPLMNEIRALNRSATYQVQIGMELERQGELEESVVAHEKALELDPKMVQAHINLIALYGRLGRFGRAEDHYKAAVELDPGSAESYYDYGVLLLRNEKFAEAETAFQKTLEIDPFHAAGHINLGFLLERQGRLSDAMAEYREAVANSPNDRQTHFNLGRILVNLKKYSEGIQELRKTLEPVDADTPRYLYALGAALARSGDRQNAVLNLRHARDQAQARGQSELVTSIDRDLHALEGPGTPQ